MKYMLPIQENSLEVVRDIYLDKRIKKQILVKFIKQAAKYFYEDSPEAIKKHKENVRFFDDLVADKGN